MFFSQRSICNFYLNVVVVTAVIYKAFCILFEWLIPLAPAVLQVVPERVGGGRDGRDAAIVAGVRGPVPRRGGLRPLAAREAVARRVPLPGLRPRQGMGAGAGAADP